MNQNRIFQMVFLTIFAISTSNITLAQTHLILGGEDEEFEAMILRPRQIEEGPDGNLYVLDGGDSYIKVYSPAGDFLRKLAGPGEGPGEFQRTDGSTFGFTTDGNLFFTEFFGGHRWLTLMELNGDLIRTLSPQLQVNYGIEAAVSLSNGGFLIQFAFDSEAFPSHDYYLYNIRQSLVQIDSLGAIVTEVVQTEYQKLISYSPNGGTSYLPFTPLFAWVYRQDNTILWSDGLNPNLGVFDIEGQYVQDFETTLPPPQKVTSEDLKSWIKNRKEFLESRNPSWWNRFGRVIEEYDKSLFDKPIFQDISAAPSNHLLVSGPSVSDSDQPSYWLLDPLGNQIASITKDVGSLRISDNYLFFFSTLEDGNTSVNAMKWKGRIGESLSFLEAFATSTSE